MKKIVHSMIGSMMAFALPVTGALAEDVTLTLWTQDGPGESTFVFAEEFTSIDNGVTVDIREIHFDDLVGESLRAFATGNAPDIIVVDNPEHALFSSRGAFLDITDQISRSNLVNPDVWFAGPRESVTWDDRIYGVPKATNTIALYYNKDLFRAAGLNPDNPPETWDDLLSAARTLTDPDNNVYGLAFSAKASEEGTFQFLPWAQMTGASYKNINTEGAARALDVWKAFLDEGLSSPDTLSHGQWDATGTFNNGNAAMVISGPWELNRMAEDAKFDWGVALLPVPELGSERSSALGDFNYAIFSSTESPDAAFKLLEYIDSQAHRMFPEFALLPARSDITGISDPNPMKNAALAVFLEQMQYAQVRGPHPDWPKISKAIQNAIQSALIGESTAAEALSAAQVRINAVLEQ